MKGDSKKIIINREGRKNSRIEQSQTSIQQIKQSFNDQLKKLQTENKYLKTRNEILLTKTQALIQIVKKYGDETQVSNEILRDIRVLNDQQQNLERLLLEKNNRYFKCIKLEVEKFMKSIDFEIDTDKLDITNESEMLLLLMKLFKQRYDELIEQAMFLQKTAKGSKKMTKFQEETLFIDIRNQNNQLKDHVQSLTAQLQFLQLEIYSINKAAQEKKLFDKYNFQNTTEMYEKQINLLRQEVTDLKFKIQHRSQQPMTYEVKYQKMKKIVQQLQAKYINLQNQYEALTKKQIQQEQQQKRYKRIIKQKNDEIDMLEKQNVKVQQAISSLRLKDRISQNFKENYDISNINK